MDNQDFINQEIDIKQCQNTTDSLLRFNIENQMPFWWNKNKDSPKLPKMLADIEKWFVRLNKCHGMSGKNSSKSVYDFRFETLRQMIFYTSKGEDEGTKTIEILDKITKAILDNSKQKPKLKEEKISDQIGRAILYLRDTANQLEFRILTPQFIMDVHKVLMEGLMKRCSSDEGEFRKAEAFTEFNNDKIRYEPFQQVESKLFNLCDQYNAIMIYSYIIGKENKRKQIEIVFKCAAWFVIQFLKIHPFSDGNGRTARLIASYILGIISPIEIPIYNIYSKSVKDDYLKAVKLGQEKGENQGLLAIMIIESCWHMYYTLNEQLKSGNLSI